MVASNGIVDGCGAYIAVNRNAVSAVARYNITFTGSTSSHHGTLHTVVDDDTMTKISEITGAIGRGTNQITEDYVVVGSKP